MKITAHYCDLCIKDFGKLKPAVGFYITEDGKGWDVCAKHEKEINGYNLPDLKVTQYIIIGGSIDLEFLG